MKIPRCRPYRPLGFDAFSAANRCPLRLKTLWLLVRDNSGGIVRLARPFPRFRAPALLGLAPPEVFPQRGLEPLFAERLFGGFRTVCHAV